MNGENLLCRDSENGKLYFIILRAWTPSRSTFKRIHSAFESRDLSENESLHSSIGKNRKFPEYEEEENVLSAHSKISRMNWLVELVCAKYKSIILENMNLLKSLNKHY